MGPEGNLELIKDLESQIEEGNGDIIELKRSRNSLLNISVRVPPEILGYIFVLIATSARNYSLHPGPHFAGLEKGSYIFLLVCHHWLKVASNTPELWSFWGNAIQDWEKRYQHTGTAPVDLVLYGRAGGPEDLCTPLRDDLRERAAQNKIRQVHLDSNNLTLLDSIISCLTPDGEVPQERWTESVILRTMGTLPEIANFFAHSRLSKLQRLHIIGTLKTPLWDDLAPQTTRLTTLSLRLTRPSVPPTTPQLLSILGSNPNLLDLTLSDAALPDYVDQSGSRIPLPHLQTVALAGKFRQVYGLLQRLELPSALDCMKLSLDDSTLEKDITRTLGPYMQQRLERDIRFHERLNVTCLCGYINISVDRRLEQPSWLEWTLPSTKFTISVIGPPDSELKRLTVDLMAFILHNHVIYLETDYSLKIPEGLFIAMPNIEMLWLRNAVLTDRFLQPKLDGPHANSKLLPSLRSIHLENVSAGVGWEPLITYLTHQTSGNQAISAEVLGHCSRLPQKVVDEVRGLVAKFVHERMLNSDGSDDEFGD